MSAEPNETAAASSRAGEPFAAPSSRRQQDPTPSPSRSVGAAGSAMRMGPRLRALLGYTAEELRGRSLGALLHPADRTLVLSTMARASEPGGAPLQLDARLLRHDGTPVRCRLTVRREHAVADRPSVVSVTIEDVQAGAPRRVRPAVTPPGRRVEMRGEPRARPAMAPAGAPAEATRQPSGAKATPGVADGAAAGRARLLLVGLAPDVRRGLGASLGGRYVVEHVGDAVRALTSVRERTPDLVLVDAAAPPMGGVALLRTLRGEDETAGIAVLVVIASEDAATRSAAIAAGADEVVAGPPSNEMLVERIEAHVAVTDAQRSAAQAQRRQDERLRRVVESAGMSDVDDRRFARDDQRFLLDLGGALQPLGDPDEIAATASRLLGQYLGVSRCAVARIDEARQRMTVVADYTAGVPSIAGTYPLEPTQPIPTTPAGGLLELPVWTIADALAEDVDPAVRARLIATGVRSGAEVIYVRDGAIRGTLAVMRVGPHAWTERERWLLRAATQRVLPVVETAQAYHEMRAIRHRAERLQEVTSLLSGARSVRDVCEVVNRVGSAALGATTAIIAVLDEAGDALDVVDAVGVPEGLFDERRALPLSEPSLAALSFGANAPIYSESRQALAERYPETARRTRFTTMAAWAVLPLTTSESRLGAVSFGFADPRELTVDERAMAEALARQGAQALERARLFEAAQDDIADQRFLREVSETLQRAQGQDDLLRSALALVGDHFGVDRTAWVQMDVAARVGRVTHVHARTPPPYSVPAEFALPEPMSDPATLRLLGASPIVVSNASTDARLAHMPPALSDRGAVAAFPLRRDGQWVVSLALTEPRPRAWTRREVELLQAVTDRIWAASEVVRSREAAEREAQRVRRLQRVTSQLGGALSIGEAADLVLLESMRATGAAAGAFCALTDVRAGTIETVRAAGFSEAARERFLLFSVDDELPASRAIRTGETVVLESLADWSREFPTQASVAREMGIEALIEVPLVFEGETFGALALNCEAPRRFDAEEVAFLQAVALQLAQAIERARLYDAEREARWSAERAFVQVSLLQSVTAALSSTLTVDDVARAVVTRATRRLGAAFGFLAIRTASTADLDMIAPDGVPTDVMRAWARWRTDGSLPSAHAARTGESFFFEHAEELAPYPPAVRDVLHEAGVQASAVVALPAIGRHSAGLGALVLAFTSPHPFDVDERDLLRSIGRQAAQAIDRARQYEERVRAEQALRQSTAIIQAVNDSTPDLIYVKDQDGRLLFANHAVCAQFGLTADQVLGQTDLALHRTREAADDVMANDRHVMETGETQVFEEHMQDAAGGHRVFLSTKTPYRDERQRIVGIIGLSHDITERKSMEEDRARQRELLAEQVREKSDELAETYRKLRAADRMAMIGTLSAGIGHDLGNLLLPIRARLDVLESRQLDQSALEDLAAIRKSADYLQRLTKGLRMLALNPEDERGSTDEVVLAEWWAEIELLLRNLLPRGVKLEADLPPSLPAVHVSQHSLSQAVFNLVQNAGEALTGRDGGAVVVSAGPSADGTTVTLDVRDNGPGMTPEVRARCLEPFFTTKTRGLSTGLGLALVQSVVQRVGGRVEIESAPGVGTTFRLTLPTVSATATPEERPRPAKVLVALADPRRRAYVSSVLRTLRLDPQYATTSSVSGHEPSSGSDGADDALVLVTDGASRELAATFVAGDPRRRAVVFDDVPVAGPSTRISSLAAQPKPAEIRDVFGALVRAMRDGAEVADEAEREGSDV